MSIRNYSIPPSFKIDDTTVQKSPRRIAIGTPSLRLSIPKSKPMSEPILEYPITPSTSANSRAPLDDGAPDAERPFSADIDAATTIIEEADDIDVIDLDSSPTELNNNAEFYSKFKSDFRQRMDDLGADNRLDLHMSGE